MTSKPYRRPTEKKVNEKETQPSKRFRIEKIEERIAPKKGGTPRAAGPTWGVAGASTNASRVDLPENRPCPPATSPPCCPPAGRPW
jgi:hypothetical protein